MANFLISRHASVNISLKNGKTLVQHAADIGNFEMVKFLVVHKANINCDSCTSKSPLESAISHGNLEMVKLLVFHKAIVNLFVVLFLVKFILF